MTAIYTATAVLTAGLHFAFIAYMVTGGFLALRWPRTIWLHIGALIWGVGIEVIDFTCPLTWLERWARSTAGMTPLPPDGFIKYYLTGHMYPANDANVVLGLALLLVSSSWVLFAVTYHSPKLPAVSTRRER